VKRRKHTEVKVPTATFLPPSVDSLSPETEELTETVVAERTQEGDPNAEEVVAPVRSTTATRSDNGDTFTVVEQQPEFIGGMRALGYYLTKNMRYPSAAQRAGVSGLVLVKFLVEKNGEITHVQVLKELGFGTGEEAMRLVQKMPRWRPGMQSGQAVRVWYNLPINFTMTE